MMTSFSIAATSLPYHTIAAHRSKQSTIPPLQLLRRHIETHTSPPVFEATLQRRTQD